MILQRSPLLTPVPIEDLRPTQMTVGFREVAERRARWRDLGKTKRDKFLARHLIPVILGPKERYYVIDHHHLGRALHDEGAPEIFVTVIADLRRLEKDEFFTFIDNRGWLHPFDEEGVRRPASDLPASVAGLADDPYRSLAGELRHVGGFAKDTTPFSEFLWADYLRRRIKRKLVDANFEDALERAVELAKAADADHLPGWCGPVIRRPS